jgi:hypothetical protein
MATWVSCNADEFKHATNLKHATSHCKFLICINAKSSYIDYLAVYMTTIQSSQNNNNPSQTPEFQASLNWPDFWYVTCKSSLTKMEPCL